MLGGAGFLSVSGAPWLILPPLPPGVERAVPADLSLLLYVAMVFVGAATAGVAVFAWKRIDGPAQFPVIVAAFVPLVALSIVASPVPTTGSTPPTLAAAFRAVVVTGQLVLWGLIAGTHAMLTERAVSYEPRPPLSSSAHARRIDHRFPEPVQGTLCVGW